jgi:ABC-type siderophore export system fused ATPase/permease subunit
MAITIEFQAESIELEQEQQLHGKHFIMQSQSNIYQAISQAPAKQIKKWENGHIISSRKTT